LTKDTANKHEVGESLLEYADFYDYSASYPDANETNDKDEEISVDELSTNGWQLVFTIRSDC